MEVVNIKVISFFNNKGGVGKTTLSTNIASYLSIHVDKRILFIDADPQANSSQMMLNDELREEIYTKRSKKTTLYSYLQPLIMGDPDIKFDGDPMPAENTRFRVDLIPGHPRISLIEDRLSEAWAGGSIGGYRVTNWLKALVEHYSGKYDIVIIDLGPSLGALNRSILINSDYFIAPLGCDIFSLMGIENIATWFEGWEKAYVRGIEGLKDTFPDELTQYPINLDISNNYRLLGFSVQQYITKVIDGERRGIKAYDEIMNTIPDTIAENLKKCIPRNFTLDNLNLGNIPHLYSLVPLAQTNNCPMHDLKSADGIVGNHFKMVKQYTELMESVCAKILTNLEGRDD